MSCSRDLLLTHTRVLWPWLDEPNVLVDRFLKEKRHNPGPELEHVFVECIECFREFLTELAGDDRIALEILKRWGSSNAVLEEWLLVACKGLKLSLERTFRDLEFEEVLGQYWTQRNPKILFWRYLARVKREATLAAYLAGALRHFAFDELERAKLERGQRTQIVSNQRTLDGPHAPARVATPLEQAEERREEALQRSAAEAEVVELLSRESFERRLELFEQVWSARAGQRMALMLMEERLRYRTHIVLLDSRENEARRRADLRRSDWGPLDDADIDVEVAEALWTLLDWLSDADPGHRLERRIERALESPTTDWPEFDVLCKEARADGEAIRSLASEGLSERREKVRGRLAELDFWSDVLRAKLIFGKATLGSTWHLLEPQILTQLRLPSDPMIAAALVGADSLADRPAELASADVHRRKTWLHVNRLRARADLEERVPPERRADLRLFFLKYRAQTGGRKP